jgi:hypothetical protein
VEGTHGEEADAVQYVEGGTRWCGVVWYRWFMPRLVPFLLIFWTISDHAVPLNVRVSLYEIQYWNSPFLFTQTSREHVPHGTTQSSPLPATIQRVYASLYIPRPTLTPVLLILLRSARPSRLRYPIPIPIPSALPNQISVPCPPPPPPPHKPSASISSQTLRPRIPPPHHPIDLSHP